MELQHLRYSLVAHRPEHKYTTMLIFEMFDTERDGYQDVAQDNSQPQLHDLRKTKLTLKQINQLRKMHDLRKFEFKEKLEKVQNQYGMSAAPAL